MKPTPCLSVRWGLVCAALAIVLAGCAGTSGRPDERPPVGRNELTYFLLEGRFALHQAAQNAAGRLRWRHLGASDELLLSTPFGQGLAEISANAQGATMTTSDGKRYEAGDAATLTERILGYGLPLGRMADWVRGSAGDGAPGQIERDPIGRLSRRWDAGWVIEYGYDNDEADAAPSRIFATAADGTTLRLRIDDWQALPAEANAP